MSSRTSVPDTGISRFRIREVVTGPHLEVVRRWIQNHARNGSTVQWGTETRLEMAPPTVEAMEQLAQDIADAVLREAITNLNICDDFTPGTQKMSVCNKCHLPYWWHEQKKRLHRTW
jgi:Lon protease-like protein